MISDHAQTATSAGELPQSFDAVCGLLLESLTELAALGRTEMACRVAGHAYVALRIG